MGFSAPLENNLLTSDLEYEVGKIAKWQHIIEFFKLEEGICKISKLKYAHYCPVGRNKMSVPLASQIFSESNQDCMKSFHTLSDGKHLANGMVTADLLKVVLLRWIWYNQRESGERHISASEEVKVQYECESLSQFLFPFILVSYYVNF